MKQSITQELEYGCGVACFAFVCNITFNEAVTLLRKEYSVKYGWRPSDLIQALDNRDYSYKNNYVSKKDINNYPDGAIVLVERSSTYPVGHYLVFHGNSWMDPWINMPENNKLANAKSGFRKKLPGKAMYALVPA